MFQLILHSESGILTITPQNGDAAKLLRQKLAVLRGWKEDAQMLQLLVRKLTLRRLTVRRSLVIRRLVECSDTKIKTPSEIDLEFYNREQPEVSREVSRRSVLAHNALFADQIFGPEPFARLYFIGETDEDYPNLFFELCQ